MRISSLIFGLLLLVAGCDVEPLPSDGSDDVHGAWAYMQLFVEKELTSPASADFPFGGAQDVTDLGGGRYRVDSYVDSQNAFGATVRSKFRGVIRKGNDKWHLEELDFTQ